MFIMLMLNKLVITHTEHRACDIYERRDTAGMVGALFYSSFSVCVCVCVCLLDNETDGPFKTKQNK